MIAPAHTHVQLSGYISPFSSSNLFGMIYFTGILELELHARLKVTSPGSIRAVYTGFPPFNISSIVSCDKPRLVPHSLTSLNGISFIPYFLLSDADIFFFRWRSSNRNFEAHTILGQSDVSHVYMRDVGVDANQTASFIAHDCLVCRFLRHITTPRITITLLQLLILLCPPSFPPNLIYPPSYLLHYSHPHITILYIN